ncbi:hypothetical protein ACP26L_13575 [Paenibacillus sp. S-38]|uniref:hypothetical protein n=1 Tax=Paenibacillus sp. S-38 TaxID=3416710 RepID=UPI003CF3D957
MWISALITVILSTETLACCPVNKTRQDVNYHLSTVDKKIGLVEQGGHAVNEKSRVEDASGRLFFNRGRWLSCLPQQVFFQKVIMILNDVIHVLVCSLDLSIDLLLT